MLGLVLVACAAAFAVGAVRRLGVPLTRFESVAFGVAIALSLAPWILFLCAWGLGFAVGLPVGAALLAAAGLAMGRGRRLVVDAAPPPSRISWFALGLLFALAYHGHMFHAEAGGLYTGGSSYGDLALHSTLASRFTVDEVDLQSPLVAGAPLTYPFLGDFLVACLMRAGWSMSFAFTVTGWLAAMSGLALVDSMARRMSGHRAAGTIAVWLIVLSGALVGLWNAGSDLVHRGLPSSLAEMPNYGNMAERGVSWTNIVADFFLPQRALLAAFPAVWSVLWLARAVAEGQLAPAARRRALIGIAVLAAALPLLHIHSFLLVVALLGWTAIHLHVVHRRAPWAWWITIAATLALAAPQLFWQLGGSFHSGFGRWNLGWLAPDGGVAWYWLRNWGVPMLLIPAAGWYALRARGAFALVLVTGALVVFVAGNLYQFQPHAWDNMKFFVYAHMMLAVVLGGALAAWWTRGGARQALAALAIFSMTGTGALILARELDMRSRLATPGDLKLAAALRQAIPPDARVLTTDEHNHVVPMLAGRKIVMGYRGWLWTHGIDYRPLERDVRVMFAGGPAAVRRLRHHHVTHVYIGPQERRRYHPDADWYRSRYPRVFSRDDVEVFDVRQPLDRVAARSP